MFLIKKDFICHMFHATILPQWDWTDMVKTNWKDF